MVLGREDNLQADKTMFCFVSVQKRLLKESGEDLMYARIAN